MNNVLKFKLKFSYRDPIAIEAKNSIFRGRDNELRRLKNLIKFRKSASVLISGVRGVGKTAFTHEALRQVRGNNDSFPVIDITFANLVEDANSETKLREGILKSLIRGLYLNKEARETAGDSLEKLYDKTFYSDIKKTGFLESSRQEIISREEKNTNEKVYKLDLSPTLEIIARILGSTFSLYFLLNFLNSLPIIWQWWQLMLITSVAGGIFILLLMTKFEFKTSLTFVKGLEDKISEKISGSKAAKYDLSADTLEAELKQVLVTLTVSGSKAIFVIDELDKLDDSQDGDIKQKVVYKIVKTFKNLFSVSNAIFIFITNSDFYDLLEDKKFKDPYSTFHTIFTDRIFLSSLYYQDIENIIDGFKDGKIKKDFEDNYKKFRSYISWKAKNHIFDTHNLIEEYTQHDETGNSYVSVFTGDNQKRGNIDENWEIAAATQVYISATYDEKSYPADPRVNERLYLTLRTIGEILYNDYEITVTEGNYLETIPSDRQEALGINKLSQNIKQDFSGAIEDFLRRTEKFGLTVSKEEIKQTGTPEAPSEKKNVRFEIVGEGYPDLETIKKTTVKSEFENEFVQSLEILGSIKNNLSVSDLSDLFNTYQTEYNNFLKTKKPIVEEKPRKRLKSQILNDDSRVKQIIDELKNSIPKTIIQNVAANLGLSSHAADTSPSGQPMWDIDGNLANFFQFVTANKKFDQDYIVLSKTDKHLLVGINLDQSVQNEYIKISKGSRRTAKTKVINILQNEASNKKGEWRVFKISQNLGSLSSFKSHIEKYFS